MDEFFSQRISCTIAEACKATGIGRTRLYEEISAGRIETAKVGRRRLVRVRSLVKLLDPEAMIIASTSFKAPASRT